MSLTAFPGPWPPGNPFSTRRVRPGAVPFVFPAGLDTAVLVARLAAGGWQGQIVGGHGTGKSTLLAALEPEVRRAGREPIRVDFHDGRRRAGDWAGAIRLGASSLLIVDGFEQVTPWRRAWLAWRCRVAGCGLLVTAHVPVGLPVLYRTAVDAETAWAVVTFLTRDVPSTVTPGSVAVRLAARRGDLREAMFDLYDQHESARPTTQA